MMFVHSNRNVVVDASLQPMFDALSQGHRRAARGLFTFSGLAFAFAAPILSLSKDSAWPAWLSVCFGLFVIATSLAGLIGMHRERLLMERMLEDALIAEEAKISLAQAFSE